MFIPPAQWTRVVSPGRHVNGWQTFCRCNHLLIHWLRPATEILPFDLMRLKTDILYNYLPSIYFDVIFWDRYQILSSSTYRVSQKSTSVTRCSNRLLNAFIGTSCRLISELVKFKFLSHEQDKRTKIRMSLTLKISLLMMFFIWCQTWILPNPA